MTLRTETVAAEAMDLAKSILSAPNDDERTYKSDRDFATATDYAARRGLAHARDRGRRPGAARHLPSVRAHLDDHMGAGT